MVFSLSRCPVFMDVLEREFLMSVKPCRYWCYPVRILMSAAVLLPLAGCGGGSSPWGTELGTVRGTVTLDGQPLANAILMLVPDGEGTRRSSAKTDSSGKYNAMYSPDVEGVPTGPCTVMVSFGLDLSRGVVPPKYSSESVLKFEVKPGENTYDIKMTSN